MSSLVVASVYVPPTTSQYAPNSYASTIEDLCAQIQSLYLVAQGSVNVAILGDLNAHCGGL
jgi:hypothetical protein